jgi:hydrogenase 3 maturation protease
LLAGIGNPLRQDDGAGVFLSENFSAKGWVSLPCHTAIESFTGKIKQFKPHTIVLVDAADLNLEPGAIRIIPKEKIKDAGIGTHSLPLDKIMDYLETVTKAQCMLIGIQPLNLDLGEGLSQPVKKALLELKVILAEKKFNSLELF